MGLGADDMYCVGSYIEFGSVDGACKFSDYDYYDWDSTYVDAVQVCDMSNHGHGEHSAEGQKGGMTTKRTRDEEDYRSCRGRSAGDKGSHLLGIRWPGAQGLRMDIY